MSASASRPSVESVTIAGSAGRLEAIVETPASATGARAAVICHPHPLHGGTMTNKVVHMLARSCNEVGAAALRFNYRGVGASEGGYDEGRGETDDAVAALDWARTRWPGAELWLCGFSFGGVVAIRSAVRRDVRKLVTVAPAIDRLEVGTQLPQRPWLLVQGDRDELVDPVAVRAWAEALPMPPQIAILPGVDHFFHGKLNELRALLVRWLEESEVRQC
jgi:uncharacterized protein